MRDNYLSAFRILLMNNSTTRGFISIFIRSNSCYLMNSMESYRMEWDLFKWKLKMLINATILSFDIFKNSHKSRLTKIQASSALWKL